jgi:Macrocin-O-methyltransferase (TylF)
MNNLYLDLMKLCLTDMIYGDVSGALNLNASEPFNEKIRREGRDWPAYAHTMIGMKRLDNLHKCCESVLARNVPGDFIETGVWRGGASIFMRAVLKEYRVSERVVWVADSFQGLPRPNAEKYPADEKSRLYERKEFRVRLEEVRANFAKYGLLDEQVKFLSGWFKDTLPTAPIKQLAILRLDGDLYESTMDALTNLYPKVSAGGYVLVDDYGGIWGCKKAIDEFSTEHGITLRQVDPEDYWQGVYWKV